MLCNASQYLPLHLGENHPIYNNHSCQSPIFHRYNMLVPSADEYEAAHHSHFQSCPEFGF